MSRRRALALTVGLLAYTPLARADNIKSKNVLDTAVEHFRDAAADWQDVMHSAATTLFWSLAAISLVWTLLQQVVRRADLGEVAGEVLRYILFTGFWAWMLENGPEHARLIIDSLNRLASSATGGSGNGLQTPSRLLDIGFSVFESSALSFGLMSNPIDAIVGALLAVAVLIVLALVTVNMLVVLVSCWFVAYGGLIVLGFGGSKWTSDMAVNYYKTMLSLGLQVMAMVLLIGVGEGLLESYHSNLDADISAHEQAVLLVVSIMLLALVNRVPALVGGLTQGVGSQYALGGGSGIAAAAVAAATTGGAALLAARAGSAALAPLATGALGAGAWGVQKLAAAAGLSSAGSALDNATTPTTRREPEAGSVFPVPRPDTITSATDSPSTGLGGWDHAGESEHATTIPGDTAGTSDLDTARDQAHDNDHREPGEDSTHGRHADSVDAGAGGEGTDSEKLASKLPRGSMTSADPVADSHGTQSPRGGTGESGSASAPGEGRAQTPARQSELPRGVGGVGTEASSAGSTTTGGAQQVHAAASAVAASAQSMPSPSAIASGAVASAAAAGAPGVQPQPTSYGAAGGSLGAAVGASSAQPMAADWGSARPSAAPTDAVPTGSSARNAELRSLAHAAADLGDELAERQVDFEAEVQAFVGRGED